MPRLIRATAVTTLIATYGLIVLGSTVRVTNSGMGCSSWPLCNGQLGPIDQFHPLMEQSHRFLAAVVTVLIALFATLVWRAGPRTRHLRPLALALVGIVAAQVLLGAITVWTKNAPVTVALHLVTGLVLLAVVTVAATATVAVRAPSAPVGRQNWLAAASVAGLLVIVLSGSLVVNGGAAAACESWPVCLASRAATRLIALQLVHRSLVLVGAVVVTTYLVALARRDASLTRRRAAYGALTLLAVQIAVGALNAIYGAPATLADVHLALAAALWSVVVALAGAPATSRWVSDAMRD